MLSVAIDANHVLVAQLESEPVAGLHASAEPKVMRQRKHLGGGLPRHVGGRVLGAIVHHQDRNFGHDSAHFLYHTPDGRFLIVRGNQDQQLHNSATWRRLMEYSASSA